MVLAFSASSKCLFESRRMFRHDTLAASACFLICWAIFLRWSPLMAGMLNRMTLPSLFGASPRSLDRIAFSISLRLSAWYGLMTMDWASGQVTDAMFLIGVGLP